MMCENCVKAWDEYKAKIKPIWEEYLAKENLIWNEYLAKKKPIYDEYEAKLKQCKDKRGKPCFAASTTSSQETDRTYAYG